VSAGECYISRVKNVGRITEQLFNELSDVSYEEANAHRIFVVRRLYKRTLK
jgi:hypothetical protein